jgi:hypothetical protein
MAVTPDLTQRIAECHAFGHQWRLGEPIGIDDYHPTIRKPFAMSTGMIGIPSECVSCTSSKVRWVTRSGESINRYDYVDGYTRRSARDEIVLTATEWRHEYVETLFAQFDVTPIRKGRKAS